MASFRIEEEWKRREGANLLRRSADGTETAGAWFVVSVSFKLSLRGYGVYILMKKSCCYNGIISTIEYFLKVLKF